MPESHACAFEKPVITLNKGIKSEKETLFSIIYPFYRPRSSAAAALLWHGQRTVP